MVTGKPVNETAYSNREDAETFIANQRKKEDATIGREVSKQVSTATGKPETPTTGTTEPTKREKGTKETDPFASKKVDIPSGPSAEQQALINRMSDIQKAFKENANRVFERYKEYLDVGMSQMEALNAAEKDITAELEADAQAAKTPKTTTAKPTTPKVGFKTEKGSVYSLDEQGKTSRTKLSEGKGKGTTYAPHSALYVTPEDAQKVMEDMQSGALDNSTSVRLGYIADGMFKTITDISQLPANVEPVVAVVDTKQNRVVGTYKAKTKPEVGLSPVEKLYNKDGTSNTHIGNKIVELFGQPKTTEKKEPKGAKKGKAPPKLTPEQQIAAEAQTLAEDYGSPGMATAIKTQEDLDAVKDYLAEVERLEGEVAKDKAAKRPTLQFERRIQEMYDRLDAAVGAGDLTPIKPLSTKITPELLEQIRQRDELARKSVKGVPSPVEDIDIDTLSDAELDAYLADVIKKMPTTSAEVDDIIEKNNNAKESKKIAKEVKSDICKGGSDA